MKKHLIAAGLLGMATLAPGQTLQEVNAQLNRQNTPDTIDLKVAVDKTFRTQPNWWIRIGDAVQSASRRFKRDLDLTVEVDKVVPYTPPDVPDNYYQFHDGILEVMPGEQDAVVFFTTARARSVAGIASHLGNHAMLFPSKFSTLDHLLTHELSHLLGAYDYDVGHPMFLSMSQMSYLTGNVVDGWDPSSLAIMQSHRSRDWTPDPRIREQLAGFLESFPGQEQLARQVFLHWSSPTPSRLGVHRSEELLHTGDPELLVYYGDLLLRQERTRHALETYERAYTALAADDPERPMLLNHMAYTLLEEGRTAFHSLDALHMAREAYLLEQNPHYLDTIGWAHYKRKEYPDAERHLRLAVAQTKGSAQREMLKHYIANASAQRDTQAIINGYKTLIANESGNGQHYLTAINDLTAAEHRKRLTTAQREQLLQWGLEAYTHYPVPASKRALTRAWLLNARRSTKDTDFREEYLGPVKQVLEAHP